MKKDIWIFIVISLVLSIFCINSIKQVSEDVVKMIIFSIVPSLFPFIFLLNFFISSDSLNYIFIKFNHKRGFRTIFKAIIIILGILLGMPAFALLIDDCIDKGYFEETEGQRIIKHFGFASFPFVYDVIIPFLEIDKKILLISVLLLSAIIFYLLSNTKEDSAKVFTPKSNYSLSFNDSFFFSIKKTTLSLVTIATTMLVFSLPLAWLKPLISEPYLYLFSGLGEFSYSSFLLAQNNDFYSLIFLVFILSFTSLSVLAQVKNLTHHIKISDFIKKRLFIAFFNVLITIVFLLYV